MLDRNSNVNPSITSEEFVNTVHLAYKVVFVELKTEKLLIELST